jgi:DNA-directed RNA polymerase subunit RPC12/RpoP
MQFRNFYRCSECGSKWTDIWPAQCDDDCPWCGARHMSPYKSEDVEESDDE